MSKAAIQYYCTACGFSSPVSYGKCPECGAWSSMEKEPQKASSRGNFSPGGESEPTLLSDETNISEHRASTGIGELDRVLGGGIALGSCILFGGEPGIGKSTLLLQVASFVAGLDDIQRKSDNPRINDGRSKKVMLASGEESKSQVFARSKRLGLSTDNILFLGDSRLENIESYIDKERPDLVIVDSVQTVTSDDIDGSQGSVSQVRDVTVRLASIAKKTNTSIFLVGHITKDGGLAGPKIIEHLVDVVIYFEGDRYHQQRIIRCVKNRFGSTNETGFFEMTASGLKEIDDINAQAMRSSQGDDVGRIYTIIMDGSRPVVAEIQALVNKSVFTIPRRLSSGSELNRLLLNLAVLERHKNISFSGYDVYLNILGGIKITDPAADLAIQKVILSAYNNEPISSGLIAFGEVGLTGEVRNVVQLERRLAEAARVGFTEALIPKVGISGRDGAETLEAGLKLVPLDNIKSL